LQGTLRGKRWIVGSSVHGCWLGSYEHRKQAVFEEHVRKGDVVYDVGAHVGFYALLASVLVGPEGRVVAIEPVPRNLRCLHAHLRINGVGNVDVVEAALAERSGSGRMNAAVGSSQAHLDEGGDIEVRCLTLDELVFGEGFPAPDVLKLDVEGAEHAVLCGGRRVLAESRPVVFVATHGARAKADCRRLLVDSGYEVRPIGAEAVEDTDELLGLPLLPK
jgi:FkbM family methyltransferase